MKMSSIKYHLRKYSIHQKRSTTINNAFASAVAPCDKYCEKITESIVKDLEVMADGKIHCVYCGLHRAETWDHLFPLVKNNEPSGFGHTYGNLVPCCKVCNSRKGGKKWDIANDVINSHDDIQRNKVIRVIQKHLSKYKTQQNIYESDELKLIKGKILELMKEADAIIKNAAQQGGAAEPVG